MALISSNVSFAKEFRAPFIAIEGTDGSGVSTQTELLAKALRNELTKVFVTKEPSDGPVGAMIRLFLAKRLASRKGVDLAAKSQAESLALFFAADRIDHYRNVILPKTNEGITVICDRYYLSSYAYQGPDVEDDDWLQAINAKVMKPDLTIFLKVGTQTCLERIQRRSWHFELFETYETLSRVQRAYDKAIQRLRHAEAIEVIDANQAPSEVHAAVLAAVQRRFTNGLLGGGES